MENRENKHQEVSAGMKVCRVVGIVLVVFMAAFTFAHGSFQKPERRYIRRQLYMFSSLFALLGLCWIILLALIK